MSVSRDSPPTKSDLDACRRCPLWERATQGVPGEGPRRAPLMLVGEQPGDEEDRQGKPFVGPAGKLLRRALDDAGVARDEVYITNAVKHFSWEPRGKRRIHKTPAQREIAACHDWLESEIAAEHPVVIVALGATALRAIVGRKISIAEARANSLVHASGAQVVATYHPSAVLRAPEKSRQAELYDVLVADLQRAHRMARGKEP
jgi:uracil-DNA glycosylase family protein